MVIKGRAYTFLHFQWAIEGDRWCVFYLTRETVAVIGGRSGRGHFILGLIAAHVLCDYFDNDLALTMLCCLAFWENLSGNILRVCQGGMNKCQFSIRTNSIEILETSCNWNMRMISRDQKCNYIFSMFFTNDFYSEPLSLTI